jgi:hypothetical protein
MPSLSAQDITNILIAVIGLGAFIVKTFVEPRLPANMQAFLFQSVQAAVQHVEQIYADNYTNDQKKAYALRMVKDLFAAVHLAPPSDALIGGVIESAVFLLKQNKLLALPDRATISTQAVQRSSRMPNDGPAL